MRAAVALTALALFYVACWFEPQIRRWWNGRARSLAWGAVKAEAEAYAAGKPRRMKLSEELRLKGIIP
jgi:hypothetical protein